MSPVQKQRIIGAILLLSGLVGVAVFLMSNASSPDNVPEPSTSTSGIEQDYVSVIETMPEGDIEVVEDKAQVFVDANSDISVNIPKTELIQAPKVSKAETKVAVDKVATSNDINTIAEELEKTVVKTSHITAKVKSEEQKVEWVLQVASFSVRDNANNLNAKLQSSNYKSYIDPIKTSAGKLIYRVRIGPESDKTKLEQAASNLSKKFQLKSQLLQQKN